MPSLVETFGRLLDQSIEQIAQVSADARRYDGSLIYRLSDIWDNNTFPLLATATASPLWRERRARKGLRWMADFGADRRGWMVEVEPALGRILPDPTEPAPLRDYLGQVRPVPAALEEAQVAALEADYDLSEGRVRTIRLEATTTGPEGHVAVEAPRRYAAEDSSVAAVLHFSLRDLVDLRFDASDLSGVSVRCGTDVSLRLGRDGLVRGGSGAVWPDDLAWHRSRAGAAADAIAPRRQRKRDRHVFTGGLHGAANAAAELLRQAMVTVRRVRHPRLAPGVAVHPVCAALRNAGTDLVAAGAEHGRHRTRAFTDLMAAWTARGATVEWCDEHPLRDGPVLVRYARYTAPHTSWLTRQVAATACVNAAAPDADPATPWRLTGGEIEDPAEFRITLAAVTDIGEICTDDDGLTLGDALTVRRAGHR